MEVVTEQPNKKPTIPDDYKRTEVGIIPVDWEVPNLIDITQDILQGVNTAVDIPEYKESGIPILKANNIIDQHVNFKDADHISIETYKGYSQRYKLKINDFLFSNIGARLGTGSLFKSNKTCTFAWNVMKIRPDRNYISPSFFHFIMNSNLIYSQVKRVQLVQEWDLFQKGKCKK